MSTPATRRAEQLRSLVLDTLRTARGVGLSSYVIWYTIRGSLPGSPSNGRQVGHALTVLRRRGDVRYVQPYWVLVPCSCCGGTGPDTWGYECKRARGL